MADVKPMLTIYTPTYKRPTYLKRCLRSVENQTCQDYQHLVVRDEIGIGIAGMFAEIINHLSEMKGNYIYLLQDDDVLASPDVLEELKKFLQERNRPEVIMVRNVKRGRLLPTYWEQAPQLGHVDLGSYIIRRDIFVKNIYRFGPRYEGDFDFIMALWNHGYQFAWLDVLFARAQALGLGRPESELVYEGPVEEMIVEPAERAVERR